MRVEQLLRPGDACRRGRLQARPRRLHDRARRDRRRRLDQQARLHARRRCSRWQRSASSTSCATTTTPSSSARTSPSPRSRRSSSDRIPELAGILNIFGSPQIKNAGTLIGNIANGSPIGDTLPYLFVAGAELELAGINGTRTVPIADFYLGYKKFDLARRRDHHPRARPRRRRHAEALQGQPPQRPRHLRLHRRHPPPHRRRHINERRDRVRRRRHRPWSASRAPKRSWPASRSRSTCSSKPAASPAARSTPISDVRGSAEYRAAAGGEHPAEVLVRRVQRYFGVMIVKRCVALSVVDTNA